MPETADEAALSELWTRRRVEFSDTDLSGIIHFSRYPVFMESAEHELFAAIGSSVHATIDGRTYGWPRLAVGFEFLRPVTFEDELRIRILILRKGTKALTFGCELYRGEDLVARGQMSSACCILEPGEPMRAVPIPAAIADRLAEVPREVREEWKPPIRPL